MHKFQAIGAWILSKISGNCAIDHPFADKAMRPYIRYTEEWDDIPMIQIGPEHHLVIVRL